MSEIIAKDEGPFIESELFVSCSYKDICPDKQRNFQDSYSAQSCTRCMQKLKRLYLEANTFDC